MVGVDSGSMIGALIEIDSSSMVGGPTEELVEKTSLEGFWPKKEIRI
jgi:hypothetical protein